MKEDEKGGLPRSFLFRKDNLLSLALPLLKLLLGVFPLVLLLPLDGRELLVLDLLGPFHDLRDMPMALDTPDLGHVAVPFGQSRVVLEGLSLSCGLDALPLGCVGAP